MEWDWQAYSSDQWINTEKGKNRSFKNFVERLDWLSLVNKLYSFEKEEKQFREEVACS